jgi:RNA-directed DNA polymerase
MMHGLEKSDLAIVAMKPANKGAARGLRSGWSQGRGPRGTRGLRAAVACHRGWTVYGKLQGREEGAVHRIAAPSHVDLLRGVPGAQAPCGAGVDGVTWRDYEARLEHQPAAACTNELHRGKYRAKPVATGTSQGMAAAPAGHHGTGRQDRAARAGERVLNAIYEEDFLGFSYGFRPGRGQHDALDALGGGDRVRG